MGGHVCFGVKQGCFNPEESYGEICVCCNACGRLNKETMLPDRLATFKRHLEAAKAAGAVEGLDEFRKSNIKCNVEYYKQAIREVEKEMEVNDDA